MVFDILAVGLAFTLLAFALIVPAAATAIDNSDAAAGLSFISPPLSWLLAVIALATAGAILVFGPRANAVIDRSAAAVVTDRSTAARGQRPAPGPPRRGVVGVHRAPRRTRPA
ncbi:hypothetical protein MAUB1S_11789 [Mycolicibacterium aubagnense]